jgi:Mn-dependent DtxR family transcriptional regulator
LLTLDRVDTRELVITQELIAGMLGVRREGVTEAAGKLQRAGLISYRRGHIAVLDRAGLEAGACECYALVKKELNRLLSDVLYRQEEESVAASDNAPRLSTSTCNDSKRNVFLRSG